MKSTPEPMTVKITKELRDQVRALAEKEDRSESSIVRLAISLFLQHKEQERQRAQNA